MGKQNETHSESENGEDFYYLQFRNIPGFYQRKEENQRNKSDENIQI